MKPLWMVAALLCIAACTPGTGKQNSDPDVPPTADALCPLWKQSEDAFSDLKLLDDHGPMVTTRRQRDALRGFLEGNLYEHWCHDQFRGDDLRMTGPIAPVASRTDGQGKGQTTAFSTHSRVRVYYSKQMFDWLAGGRRGEIPDGAAMVKEMHPSLEDGEHNITDIDGFAVMVRDASSTKDGWLWYLHYRYKNSAYNLPFRGGQYGNSFCLSCHAAATAGSTFAEWGNLVEEDVPTYLNLPGNPVPRQPTTTHGRIPAAVFQVAQNDNAELPSDEPNNWNLRVCALMLTQNSIDQDAFYACVMNAPITEPLDSPASVFAGLFEQFVPEAVEIGSRLPRRLPQDLIHDHLPPGPDGPDWVTSSACNACHEASDLLNGTNAEMSVPLRGRVKDFDDLYPIRYANEQGLTDRHADKAALAPFAEWTGSLMSVSARDPVFRAQLEWETTRYPEHAGETTELCLSCHAPAGQRAHPELARDLSNTYANAYDNHGAEAEFAGLARDGVTCVICHRMTDKNFGKPESFTAHFELGPADVVNGPFDAHVQVDPMQSAIGVTPGHAAHVEDSALCGTCHMVDTPVYDNPDMDKAHEQTTYLEWRSSEYAEGRDTQRSCQNCHMPDTDPLNDGALTQGKIANYEDSEFPFVPNRKAAALVDTVDRPGYRRHTLVGINLFTMNLFQQFPYLLGSHTFNPARQFAEIVPPKSFATHEAVALARNETADVGIENLTKTPSALTFEVHVDNKAGHKFPTGVGFRRAVLEVAALDGNGTVLWCSGCTNEVGQITDTAGDVLPTEVAIQSKAFQPDYSEIVSDGEVQIYETRHVNNAGWLTTSFVELDEEVKDNRLLPAGYRAGLFPDYDLEPVAASWDPDNPAHDIVQYSLPAEVAARTATVRARMYYQALPPYYLIDRVTLLENNAELPETQRLLYMLLHLNLNAKTHGARAIHGWRLPVGETATVSVARGL